MPSPVQSPILIIFDVDGTLIDATAIDNDAFDNAFLEVTGVNLTASIWSQFKEVTSQAVVHQALGEAWPDLIATTVLVKDSFFEKLQAAHEISPTAIRAFAGAVGLLTSLKENPDFEVAIATGCWRETAHFKLKTAGFDLTDIPFACSSDCYARSEIISLAAERAGVSLARSVYVGDGIWDLRAARHLGIPFIGVGRNVGALRQAGAEYTLDVLNAETLLQKVRQLW